MVCLDLVTSDSLVFPAASKPNINNLISLFPKILPESGTRVIGHLKQKTVRTKRFGEIGTHCCIVVELMVKNDVAADSCLEKREKVTRKITSPA